MESLGGLDLAREISAWLEGLSEEDFYLVGVVWGCYDELGHETDVAGRVAFNNPVAIAPNASGH